MIEGGRESLKMAENHRSTDHHHHTRDQRTPARPIAVSPSPTNYLLASTPSPYAMSVMTPTTTGVTGKPSRLQLWNLILRGMALFFSVVAGLILALATSSPKAMSGTPCSSFSRSSDYWYSVSVAFLCLVYTALQLFKGIIDIALMGSIPEKRIEYASFALDQLVSYLLVSSASILVSATMHRATSGQGRKMVNASLFMFFLCFLVVSASSVLSGYKLSKRFTW